MRPPCADLFATVELIGQLTTFLPPNMNMNHNLIDL